MTRTFSTAVLCRVLADFALGDSYVSFEFEAAGVAERYTVTEGVSTQYDVIKQTFYTNGFALLPGQMLFTDPSKTKIPMPSGEYAVVGMTGDIVHDDAGGNKVPTPLNEVYDHHWIISDLQHKNLLCPYAPNYVFGVGAESRHSGVYFPKGYGYVVKGYDAAVPWGANIHLLRTNSGQDLEGGDPYEAMKECNECYYAPNKGAECTPERNGTFQCCGDACYSGDCTCPVKAGTQMVPKTYYLRMVVSYTKDLGAITPVGIGVYTVPNCASFYGVQRNDANPYTVASTSWTVKADGVILQAVGHQHVGAVNISLFLNDGLVCASYPRYGSAEGVAGDEKGYIVEMTECFNKDRGQTLSFKAGDEVRVDSWYFVGSDDPRIAPHPGGTHLNVMGYMYMSYDLTQTKLEEEAAFGPLPTKGCETAFHIRCGRMLGFTDQCLQCVDDHRVEMEAAGCESAVRETMCKYRMPRGGAADVLI